MKIQTKLLVASSECRSGGASTTSASAMPRKSSLDTSNVTISPKRTQVEYADAKAKEARDNLGWFSRLNLHSCLGDPVDVQCNPTRTYLIYKKVHTELP